MQPLTNNGDAFKTINIIILIFAVYINIIILIFETCRYGLQRVPVEQRLCETCHVVEDEFHVVMECTLYDDIRKDCLNHISSLIPFFMLTIEEQFIQVMSNPKIYRSVSKAMYLILNRRHNVMTK